MGVASRFMYASVCETGRNMLTERSVTDHEEFADPVVIPGPNLRSLFTDTEEVDDAVAEQVEDDSQFCPSCRRVYPVTTTVCPDDATSLIQLPRPADA
jgi:hypothetical protein